MRSCRVPCLVLWALVLLASRTAQAQLDVPKLWACGDVNQQAQPLAESGRFSSALASGGSVELSTNSIQGTVRYTNHNPASCMFSCASSSSSCVQVALSDFNLFLLEDYAGGHDIQGKLAAGGNITLTDFSVGAGLPDGDIAQTLVAQGDLTLSRGGVWGETWHGGGYSSDPSVTFVRGAASHGTPVDFAARGAQLRTLSAQLDALPVNGTTTREPWGGVFLKGTDSHVNVFQMDASAFPGAVLLSINAPAGSLVVLNIHGASATFTGFGSQFSGGIDQHGVLYNFVDTTAISAHGFGFWGTVLAPYAHIDFSEGSFDGGIYARSLTGNAEGHINPLNGPTLCPTP